MPSPWPHPRLPLASAGLLFLAACSAGPDYVRPEIETVPDAWSEAVRSELADSTLATWWLAFDDPVLTDLIRRAEIGNRNLAGAVGRVREARALRGVAKSDNLPTVILGGTYTRTELSENSPQGQIITGAGGTISPTGVWDLSLNATWEIDVFGRIRRQTEAATAALEASVEDYRDVLVSLYAEVGLTYIDVRTLQLRLRYARSNAQAQQEAVQLTTDRFNAGLTSARDVAQAEANLANTRALIPSLEAAERAAMHRLGVLLGVTPTALVAELSDSTAALPGVPRDVTLGVPADLLRRRPDIRRAERQLASQTARIGVATAELYPKFSIGGLLGLTSVDFDNLFEGNSLGWGLVPGFSWNLFAGGRIRNQIEAERGRTDQALAFYEQSVLLALEETENAIVAYTREGIRRDELRRAVQASERSVDLARTQYLSGLTDFQNYLDSQRSLFGQQDGFADSEGQVLKNLILLNRALGGGWDVPEELPDEETILSRREGADSEETQP